VRFFFDANVSTKLVAALRLVAGPSADYELVALQDRFPTSIGDPDWLRALGAEGDWIVVSGDQKISRSPAERAAWREARLTTFFLGDNYPAGSTWVQAARLFEAWPGILIEAKRRAPTRAFVVNRNGKLKERSLGTE
jgi:hypothetical protein